MGPGAVGTCGATCMVAPKLERLKAADVCQIAQVQPYVLRTWEAEFPDLGQQTAAGPRIYGRADVERVLRIRELVYVEGLTLAGARRRLEESGPSETLDAGRGLRAASTSRRGRGIRSVRQGLQGVLELLEPADRRRGVRAGGAAAPRDHGARVEGRATRQSGTDGVTVARQTGCSAAWLARLLGVQEVPGSNPGIPTTFSVPPARRGAPPATAISSV